MNEPDLERQLRNHYRPIDDAVPPYRAAVRVAHADRGHGRIQILRDHVGWCCHAVSARERRRSVCPSGNAAGNRPNRSLFKMIE